MSDAPTGVASACAIGLSTIDQLVNVDNDKADRRIELRCVPLPPDATVVVVEAPMMPRLD